jgi:type I restriction enzyme S subunit
VTASDRLEGPYPYFGANGVQGTIDNYIFDEPLVLLAEDGGHFDDPSRGIAYRIEGKTWVNNHAHVLRPGDRVLLSYLHRVLEHYDVRRFITGTTRGKLTQAGAANIPIPLPPLPEQRRIAAILDQTDALRAQRRVALAEFDSLTKSIFVDMFGDPRNNPNEWPMLPFAQVCPTHLGKMLDAKQQTGKYPRPYLRNINVQWLSLDLADVAAMDFHPDIRHKYRLMDGDLLICEGGEPGRAAIWHGEMEECYFQKAVHRGRPIRHVATAEYLVMLLWFFSKRGLLADHITSATIAHLTGEKLRKMPIPVPPIALQERFSQLLMAIQDRGALQQSSASELDALFASLQHRAFRGEL